MLDIKADFWKDYRKVTGSLRWRLATPDDLPRIRRIKNVSERFLNQKQKNLPLFDPPVLLTLVAENAQGRIMDRMGKLLGNLGFNCEDGIFSRWTRNL